MIRLSRLLKTGISNYSHNLFANHPPFPILSNKIVIRDLTPKFPKQAFYFSTNFEQKVDNSQKKESESTNNGGGKKSFRQKVKRAASKSKTFWAGILSTLFGGEAIYFMVKKVPEEEKEKENAVFHEPEFEYKGDNEYTNTDPRLWKDSSDSSSEQNESSLKMTPLVKTVFTPFFYHTSTSDDGIEDSDYSSKSTSNSSGYLAEEVSDSEEELIVKRKPKEQYTTDLDAIRQEQETTTPPTTVTPSDTYAYKEEKSNGKSSLDNYNQEEEQGDELSSNGYLEPELKAEYAEELVDEEEDINTYGASNKKPKSNYITNSAEEVQSPIITSKEIRSNIASSESRDWTREFLEILEIRDLSLRSQKLRDFTNDFVNTAKKVAKVIVLESSKQDWEKSIPTLNKGVAGGQKFITNNIFFKFATDIYGIYGGDEFAAKSAAMELRGLNSIINCNIEGLFFPMMCTIDYLGKRVIASSLLPISDETLIYGSEDAGTTVHADDAEFNDKMRRIAGILNLKAHYIKQHTHLRLHLAADVEGHRGKDGKYYCLDTARVFPPEPPLRSIKSSYLYRLLRPELVRKSPVALSSDAYSGFGVIDKEENNQEVKEAFDYMIVTAIPQFAQQLVQMEKEGKFLTIEEILEELHRRGINWRYLDIFARDISSISHKSRYLKLLLIEMICRVCKEIMQLIWRQSVREGFESTADCLNMIFGDSPKSSGFWGDQEVQVRNMNISPLWKLLVKKYPRFIEIEYPHLQENLREEVEHKLLFELLLKMTGIRIRDIELKFGSTHHNPSPFSRDDIIEIEPRVKQLNLVSYLETFSLLEQAKISKDNKEKDVLFQMAVSRIEESVRSTPGDSFTLIQYGNILAEWARQKEDLNEKQNLYKRAFQQFESASSEHNLGVIPDPTIRNSVVLETKKLKPLLEVYTNWGISLMEHSSDFEKSSLSMSIDLLSLSCDKFEFALKKSRVEEPRILYNSAVAYSRLLDLRLKLGSDLTTLTTLFEKANDRFRRASKLYKEMGALQRPNVLSDWSHLLFQYGMKLDAESLESRALILSGIKKLSKSETLLRDHCDKDTRINILQKLGFVCFQAAQRIKEKSRELLSQSKDNLEGALKLISDSDVRRRDLLCNLGFVHMIEATEMGPREKQTSLQEAQTIFQQLWEQGDLRGSYNMASLFARESDEANCRHWMEVHVSKFGLSNESVNQFICDKDFDSLRNCGWFHQLLHGNK